MVPFSVILASCPDSVEALPSLRRLKRLPALPQTRSLAARPRALLLVRVLLLGLPQQVRVVLALPPAVASTPRLLSHRPLMSLRSNRQRRPLLPKALVSAACAASWAPPAPRASGPTAWTGRRSSAARSPESLPPACERCAS